MQLAQKINCYQIIFDILRIAIYNEYNPIGVYTMWKEESL